MTRYRLRRRTRRRLILAGAFTALVLPATAIAKPIPAPTAPAASHLVQIGGQLVAPDHLSAWQASAGQVTVTTSPQTSPTGTSRFDWTVLTVVLAVATLLVGAGAVVLRTTGRIRTA